MSKVLQANPDAREKILRGAATTETVVSPADVEATASQVLIAEPDRGQDHRDASDAEPSLVTDPVGEAHVFALRLAGLSELENRIAIYREMGRKLFFIAAARWPEMLPELDGEFEPLVLFSADLD